MIFSDDEISSLVRGDELLRLPPPANGGVAMEPFFRTAVQTICAETGTRDRTEWGHYGSGYASFVDAWFYHPDGRARRSPEGEDHVGVYALLSRLAGCYALGQGEKTWDAGRSCFYLPALESIDAIVHPALTDTAVAIESILNHLGLRRLHRADLEPLISPAHRVPTILSDPPFRVFDAVFHWED